jgi:ribosome-associated translation inhibitor RaiA
MEGNPKKPTIFGWADTPWTVAALLGAWGVMIGIEEFFLADVFMVLAGIASTARLARDCFQYRRRRWIPFTLWIAIIVAVVGVDIHLTERKKQSSEAKAGEIPRLNTQIENLNATVQAQSTELSNAQGHTDQHVQDIQSENERLRASIEKKDAKLESIAEKQYALNFLPQMFVASNGSADKLTFMNNGNYDLTITNLLLNGIPPNAGEMPALVAKGAVLQFTLNDIEKNYIVAEAPGGNAERLPIEGAANLTTKNGKSYVLAFTWLFNIKDVKWCCGASLDVGDLWCPEKIWTP